MLHTYRGHHPQSSEAAHARTNTTCVTHSSDRSIFAFGNGRSGELGAKLRVGGIVSALCAFRCALDLVLWLTL
eukprot:2466688-Prymnesium_polylepis.1